MNEHLPPTHHVPLHVQERRGDGRQNLKLTYPPSRPPPSADPPIHQTCPPPVRRGLTLPTFLLKASCALQRPLDILNTPVYSSLRRL